MTRVILAEDDPAIAEPLARALGREGYDVVVHGTGQGAVDAAGEADLIVLDLGLPDIDGEDVARRMRERGTSARIVALSGAPGGEDAGPFDARVTKPARVEDLTAYLP